MHASIRVFMDHATGTICLYNMGPLFNVNTALCNMRSLLCDMKYALCNKGTLWNMGVRYVI